MKSYASVEEIEKKFAVCELELIPLEESKTIDYLDKETVMVDIPTEMIIAVISCVAEGDIIVVNHEDGKVQSVCCRDDAEKQRRIDLIKQILKP